MKKLIVFLHKLKTTSFICTGAHFNTFTEQKGTYESLEVLCVYFHLKRTDTKQYSTNILNIDTSSGDMIRVPQDAYYYGFRIIVLFLA